MAAAPEPAVTHLAPAAEVSVGALELAPEFAAAGALAIVTARAIDQAQNPPLAPVQARPAAAEAPDRARRDAGREVGEGRDAGAAAGVGAGQAAGRARGR